MAGGAGVEVGAGVTLVYGFKPIVGNGAGELVRIAVLVGSTGDGWLEWAELVWVRRSLAQKQLRLRSVQGTRPKIPSRRKSPQLRMRRIKAKAQLYPIFEQQLCPYPLARPPLYFEEFEQDAKYRL